MAYGLDLRQKVIDYIENGGRVSGASVWNRKSVNIQMAFEKGTGSNKGKISSAIARQKRIVKRYTRKSRN